MAYTAVEGFAALCISQSAEISSLTKVSHLGKNDAGETGLVWWVLPGPEQTLNPSINQCNHQSDSHQSVEKSLCCTSQNEVKPPSYLSWCQTDNDTL